MQDETAGVVRPVTFAIRPASQAWEFVPLVADGTAGAWVWFRPAGLPSGLSLSVPPATLHVVAVTPRSLLAAMGIDPAEVAAWSRWGGPASPLVPHDPVWDVPLSDPGPAVDPAVHVWLHPPMQAAPPYAAAAPLPVALPPGTSPGPTASGASADATFARMESDWLAIQNLERQLDTLQRQLSDMLGKLGSLNRDLSSDEKLYADRQDVNEWQDARRWLRDCAVKVQQQLKAQTVGDASDAGRRQWFTEVYDRHVAPRRPFDGLDAAAREFEQYRKLVQTLQLQMANALGRAAQDGEQRARRILSRITAKARGRKPGMR